MLIASSAIDVVNFLTKGWLLLSLVAAFVMWVKNGAEMVDAFYGGLLIAALIGLPPLLIVKLFCWLFNVQGYWMNF